MPMSRLTLNDHQVLKLHSILLLLRPDNDPNDQEHTEEVYVEIVPDLSDAVVQPESRDEDQETSARDRLNMLPLHGRDDAEVDHEDEPGEEGLV